MSGEAISITPGQLKKLLGVLRAEPLEMPRGIKKATKRGAVREREANIPPEVWKKFEESQAAGKCVCGCGAPSDAKRRGLSRECHNQWKHQKLQIEKKDGPAAAAEFDVFSQENGDIMPRKAPSNKFAKRRREFEAKRKAVAQ